MFYYRFLAVFLCALLSWTIMGPVSAIAANHPNVIFMMADDMGMGDTSAYQDFTGISDRDQIHTPNMDRLAKMGVRFIDAHTPSSRCSPTRYALLTGRYPWRNRLKHWVLFGVQGDPMIEVDRPTLGTLLQDQGYRTGLVGKWHVGLRYRQASGLPAAGWEDADLSQPMADTPLDHGFDYCRFTSRSHATSGASPGGRKKPTDPNQDGGPGHIHGRTVVSATGHGKTLFSEGPHAYILSKLGSRHSDHAIDFLNQHRQGERFAQQPFFLYYPSNSNHSPYTPDDQIGGVPVAGAARSVAGEAMGVRYDYIYENDVALGRMLDFLEANEDPRNPGHKLIDNTIVVFTSDNGAEIDDGIASGPFRSHKGSAYEGGHRVPFVVAWKAGGVGDGNAETAGQSNGSLIGLHDMYATLAEVVGTGLSELRRGEKGAEDSVSVLAAWRGEHLAPRPMFYHDHKQAKDHAAAVFRMDDPLVDNQVVTGKWKLFFDASLLRAGVAKPVELYDLASDSQEETNRIQESQLGPLVQELTHLALLHRNGCGHRYSDIVTSTRHVIDWKQDADVRKQFQDAPAPVTLQRGDLQIQISAEPGEADAPLPVFQVNARGLGVRGGKFDQVDSGESIIIRCDQDVMIESVGVVAGNGACGGYYTVGDHAPLAIYCVDADIDSNDQSGILSDIGVLRAGESLRLSTSPHWGVETPGQWRIESLVVRELLP